MVVIKKQIQLQQNLISKGDYRLLKIMQDLMQMITMQHNFQIITNLIGSLKLN